MKLQKSSLLCAVFLLCYGPSAMGSVTSASGFSEHSKSSSRSEQRDRKQNPTNISENINALSYDNLSAKEKEFIRIAFYDDLSAEEKSYTIAAVRQAIRKNSDLELKKEQLKAEQKEELMPAKPREVKIKFTGKYEIPALRLLGLDPQTKYSFREINDIARAELRNMYDLSELAILYDFFDDLAFDFKSKLAEEVSRVNIQQDEEEVLSEIDALKKALEQKIEAKVSKLQKAFDQKIAAETSKLDQAKKQQQDAEDILKGIVKEQQKRGQKKRENNQKIYDQIRDLEKKQRIYQDALNHINDLDSVEDLASLPDVQKLKNIEPAMLRFGELRRRIFEIEKEIQRLQESFKLPFPIN